MRVVFRGIPAIKIVVEAELKRKAEIAKTELRERLSHSGSGEQHAGLPNRSSAGGEYPAQQFGALHDSIDARAIGPLLYGVGSFDAPDEAHLLENRPPSEGGRPWLSKALVDPEFREKIKKG